MSVWKKLGIIVVAIIILITSVYLIFRTTDFDTYHYWVEKELTHILGREVKINGEVNIALGLSPNIIANDVSIANVSWGSQPYMTKIGQLELEFPLKSLLTKKVDIDYIHLEDGEILIEQDRHGNLNWVSPKIIKYKRGLKKPLNFSFDNIHIKYHELKKKEKQKQSVYIKSLDGEYDNKKDQLNFDLKTRYQKRNVRFWGSINNVESLQAKFSDLKLHASVSGNHFSLNGKFKAPSDSLWLEGNYTLTGNNFATLSRIAGVQLPTLDHYRFSGKFTAKKNTYTLSASSRLLLGRTTATLTLKYPNVRIKLNTYDVDAGESFEAFNILPNLSGGKLDAYIDLRSVLPTSPQYIKRLTGEVDLFFDNAYYIKHQPTKQGKNFEKGMSGEHAPGIKINCFLGKVQIKNGFGQIEALAVDTKGAFVIAIGNIDLLNQTIDLLIHPHGKNLVFSLFVKDMELKGPINQPHLFGADQAAKSKIQKLLADHKKGKGSFVGGFKTDVAKHILEGNKSNACLRTLEK